MKNITIKNRIIVAIALVNVLLLVIAITGWSGLYRTNESLRTVFEDRVVPLNQLSDVRTLLSEMRLRLTASVGFKNIEENTRTIATLDDNLQAQEKTWNAYMATYLTPEETILAKKFAEDKEKYLTQVVKPGLVLVKSANYAELEKLLATSNRTLFEPLGEGIEKLIALQVNVSKEEYDLASNRAQNILIALAAIFIVSVGLSGGMGVSLFRAIVVPLRTARGYFDRMATGDLNVQIVIEHHDEITQILDAALAMQKKLREDMADAERRADEANRVKDALDNVVVGVMIADNDRKLIYVNKSGTKLLKHAEPDIRKQLPNFSADNLVGTNIDSFHKNPGHQAQMLANLNSSYVAHLEIGGRRLQVTANPLFNARGERAGSVAEWADLTEETKLRDNERKLAAENTRVKIALDNVSTGVMIADKDRNIVYVNKSVTDLLRVAEADIRKQLPSFSVDRLIGTNIDSFHKNPAHQAQLLNTFTQPYTAQMSIGPRQMRVVANPVVNEKGERLGAVAEWSDLTLEIATQNEVATIVDGASLGDFSRRLALEGKSGFFRQLAESINQLLATSEKGLSDLGSVLSSLADGDLTERMQGDYQGMFGQLMEDTNRTMAQLTEILQQIKEATDAINTASKEIAMGNADLSQRTEEQASSLQETASSLEQLSSTVKQNADNAKQANQMAVAASDVAVKGGDVVQQVVGTMSAINDSARKIVDIISVIDGIAFQTNILALNAAVEAARAGEQGRGFAVVAGEVRNLAQRSAAAAKEIKTLINDSVDKVENGATLVQQAGTTMDEIVSSVKRVTDIMAEISAASLEQSSGIDQVNVAITQIDEVTQQNAALVEEAAAAAESLEEQADNLAQSVSRFRLQSQGVSPRLATSSGREKLMPPPKSGSKNSGKAAKQPARPLKTVEDDDEWAEF